MAKPKSPFVSIVIPVFNEAAIVERSTRELVLGAKQDVVRSGIIN